MKTTCSILLAAAIATSAAAAPTKTQNQPAAPTARSAQAATAPRSVRTLPANTTPAARTLSRVDSDAAAGATAPANPPVVRRIKARDMSLIRQAANTDNDAALTAVVTSVTDPVAALDRPVQDQRSVGAPQQGTAGCQADMNNDALLDERDVFMFLDMYFAGDKRADYNGNRDVSVQDLFDFVQAFLGGCSSGKPTPVG